MSVDEKIARILAELVANPPYDEMWCCYCDVASYDPHGPDCIVRAAAEALGIDLDAIQTSLNRRHSDDRRRDAVMAAWFAQRGTVTS